MIPVKNNTYHIAFKGYHEYDGYIGKALCINDKPDRDGWFEFKLLDHEGNSALFDEKDIVSQIL